MTLAHQLRRATAFGGSRYLRLIVGDEPLGWLAPAFARMLCEFPEVFETSDTEVTLRARSFASRSAMLDRVARRLASRGIITGWRNERYTAYSPADGSPLFDLERAAWRRFGICSRASHLNGFVRDASGLRMWIARRSTAKPVDPGKLDNLVGGGIASGMDAQSTLVKECMEEAGIANRLAALAVPAGSLRVTYAVEDGLHDEKLFVFDLALPAEFRPVNQDGEVSEFKLLDARELPKLLAAGDFTIDAASVAIDFLCRYGALGADPDVFHLLAQMRAA